MNEVIEHYNKLIDENNDPVHDSKPLKDYMDKWDGERFIESMKLKKINGLWKSESEQVVLPLKLLPSANYFGGLIFLPKQFREPLKTFHHITTFNLSAAILCPMNLPIVLM